MLRLPRRRRSTSILYDSRLLHRRELFVIDYRLHSDLLLNYDKSRKSGSHATTYSQSLRHPSSHHIISKYASYIYNTGSYHFNQLGEYTFDLIPSDFTNSPQQQWIDKNSYKTASSTSKSHDLVVWPDQLLIRNLQEKHIPDVYKLCLKETVWDAASLLHDLDNSGDVNVQHLSDILIVVSCQKTTIVKAMETLQWFETCFQEQTSGGGLSVSYLLTSDGLRGPQSGVDVMILEGTNRSSSHRHSSRSVRDQPQSDRFENVLSIKEVGSIVSSICRHHESNIV